MKARDLMCPEAISVAPDTSVRDAGHIMVTQQIACIPVLDDEGRVTGVVSSLDLLERVTRPTHLMSRLSGDDVMAVLADLKEQRHDKASKTADEIKEPLVTVGPDASMTEAVEALVKSKHRFIGVVEDGDKLIGVISRTDLLRILYGSLLEQE